MTCNTKVATCDECVSLKLTREVKERARKEACESGKSLSGWIRELVEWELRVGATGERCSADHVLDAAKEVR